MVPIHNEPKPGPYLFYSYSLKNYLRSDTINISTGNTNRKCAHVSVLWWNVGVFDYPLGVWIVRVTQGSKASANIRPISEF